MAPGIHSQASSHQLMSLTTVDKTSSRASKPAMERRRRERINRSLDELKSTLIESLRKDATCHSKLEKADILEMTVHYIKTTKAQQQQNHQNQQNGNTGVPTNVQNIQGESLNQFNNGYNYARNQLIRYFQTPQGASIPEIIRKNMLMQLNSGIQKFQPKTPGLVSPIQMTGRKSPVKTIPQVATPIPQILPNASIIQAQQNLARINAQIAATQHQIRQQHQISIQTPVQAKVQAMNQKFHQTVTQNHNQTSPAQHNLPRIVSPINPKNSPRIVQQLNPTQMPVLQNMIQTPTVMKKSTSSGGLSNSSSGCVDDSRSVEDSGSMSPVSVGDVEDMSKCWRPW